MTAASTPGVQILRRCDLAAGNNVFQIAPAVPLQMSRVVFRPNASPLPPFPESGCQIVLLCRTSVETELLFYHPIVGRVTGGTGVGSATYASLTKPLTRTT